MKRQIIPKALTVLVKLPEALELLVNFRRFLGKFG